MAQDHSTERVDDTPLQPGVNVSPPSAAPHGLAAALVGTISAAVGGSADDGIAVEQAAGDLAEPHPGIAQLAQVAALEATGAVPSAAAVLDDPLQAARNEHVVAATRDPGARDGRWMIWLVLALVALAAVWWMTRR